MKALLTIKEASSELNVTQASIRSWVFKRVMPGVIRVGGCVRIKASAIQEIQEHGLPLEPRAKD